VEIKPHKNVECVLLDPVFVLSRKKKEGEPRSGGDSHRIGRRASFPNNGDDNNTEGPPGLDLKALGPPQDLTTVS